VSESKVLSDQRSHRNADYVGWLVDLTSDIVGQPLEGEAIENLRAWNVAWEFRRDIKFLR
jgi:hypothetical protein